MVASALAETDRIQIARQITLERTLVMGHLWMLSALERVRQDATINHAVLLVGYGPLLRILQRVQLQEFLD